MIVSEQLREAIRTKRTKVDDNEYNRNANVVSTYLYSVQRIHSNNTNYIMDITIMDNLESS